MSDSSALPPAALPCPSRLWTGLGPKATLPPALLHRAATAAETPVITPPLRSNKPAAAAVNGHVRKKRSPALPPSGKGPKKPNTAQQTPPASCSMVVDTATAERKRAALDKKVAGCLLIRSWAGGGAAAAAWRQEGRHTALWCVCPELPRGSRCALHQEEALGRSRMEEQNGGVPPVGGGGGGGSGGEVLVLVPTVRAGQGAEMFAEYVRWRKNVWMPSRFYKEHVHAIDAGLQGGLNP